MSPIEQLFLLFRTEICEERVMRELERYQFRVLLAQELDNSYRIHFFNKRDYPGPDPSQ